MTKPTTASRNATLPEVFRKLNLKDQREILVLAAPASFRPALEALEQVEIVEELCQLKRIGFAIAFATRRADLERVSAQILGRAEDDPILWFAYPKGSSKRYHCDFNRDSGWETIRAAGFDSVRQISIDVDWSALRFRRIAHIRNPTRRA